MNDPYEDSAYSQLIYERRGMWDAWQALNEIANATEFGYTENLWPDMYKPLNVKAAKAHIRSVERNWAKECGKRDHMGCFDGAPALSQMPECAQIWLHQQLKYLREI